MWMVLGAEIFARIGIGSGELRKVAATPLAFFIPNSQLLTSPRQFLLPPAATAWHDVEFP